MRFGSVLAVLALAAIPVVAQAQDRSTEDRLDRIERDLNMLQRQVYRGAPTAMAGPSGGGPTNAADIEIRMERLEAQMRDLTGRVEEVGNGLDQLKQRVEQINSDIDVRLGGMGAASGTTPARPSASAAAASRPGNDLSKIAAGPPPPAGLSFPPSPPSGGLMPPGTVVPPPAGGGGLNPIFNTLTPPGTPSAPAPLPPAGQPPPAEPASTGPRLPHGSANDQFNYAFGLVKQADYGGAETALKAFIEAHPNEPLAGKAQYWLGQTYFARNRYADAATAFAEGYKRFPKGEKAPEDLLYLGLSLGKADQKKNACVALAELDQAFPKAGGAVRQRAEAEKKRLACG